MSRVIKLESAGKERNQLSKGIVVALRELAEQNEVNAETRDLVAFIAIALSSIYGSIDETVSAWENRGYWLKADRFRLDWEWTGRLGSELIDAIRLEDWASIARIAAQVAERFNQVKVPVKHRLGKPWVGAWDRLHESFK